MTTSSADSPDPGVLRTLAVVRQACSFTIVTVSAVVLCAWLLPAMGRLLPPGWEMMKANTALCALLCVASLALPKLSPYTLLIRRCLALLVILIASAILCEYVLGRNLGVDTLLASDALSQYPGRTSPHAASCLLILGVLLFWKQTGSLFLSRILDGLTLCLVFLVLVDISGYCFGVVHLFGTTMFNQTSPQTLLCLFLLTVVVFNDRVKLSVFSVMLSNGIAGKNARLAFPFTILLPFLIAIFRGFAIKNSLMSSEQASALASSGSAMLFFCLLLVLSVRIATLERNVRDISVRDDLTSLYNRRGFYVMATHDLNFANRSGVPFSVLFFDVDNLKQINDSLGHEAGSKLLKEFALILISTMRATDIIGRIGGDEFIIAGSAPAAEIEGVVRRINESVSCVNSQRDRSFPVSYSLGCVTSAPALSESLDDLIIRADKVMYQAKREKRAARADREGHHWSVGGALTH